MRNVVHYIIRKNDYYTPKRNRLYRYSLAYTLSIVVSTFFVYYNMIDRLVFWNFWYLYYAPFSNWYSDCFLRENCSWKKKIILIVMVKIIVCKRRKISENWYLSRIKKSSLSKSYITSTRVTYIVYHSKSNGKSTSTLGVNAFCQLVHISLQYTRRTRVQTIYMMTC